MTLLEQAQDYVHGDGFSVFPLVYREKTPFQKWPWKPLQARKPLDHELTAWFSKTVNLAIVTRRVSADLFVLDFDDMTAFAEWFTLTGLETRTVITGKGAHLYFRCRDGFTGNFYVNDRLAGQGRHEGGYVVAPPSVHPSGHVYRWVNTAQVLAVDLDALRITRTPKDLSHQAVPDPAAAPRPVRRPNRETRGITDPLRYAQAGLWRECEKIANTLEGSRVITLYTTACHVLRKFQPVLSREEMIAALIDAGLRAGLSERETRKTVAGAAKHV